MRLPDLTHLQNFLGLRNPNDKTEQAKIAVKTVFKRGVAAVVHKVDNESVPMPPRSKLNRVLDQPEYEASAKRDQWGDLICFLLRCRLWCLDIELDVLAVVAEDIRQC